MKVTADQSWWLTSDGYRVPKRHERAVQLLVGKGCEIEQAVLEQHPILETSEGKAISTPPETKAIDAPPQSKARRR